MYIEFANGWKVQDCSRWVLDHVIPMLGDGEKLVRRAAARRIFSWLSSLKVPPVVLGETDWDTTLLADLLTESRIDWGIFRLTVLEYEGDAQALAFRTAKQHYFDQRQVAPHHALMDARAFQAAWQSVFVKAQQINSG